MEQFLWWFLASVALISAIAAWQKPELFLDLLSPWIRKATIAALAGFLVWQLSSTYTIEAIVALIPNMSTPLLFKIQEVDDMPSTVWYVLIAFTFFHEVTVLIANSLMQSERK